MFKKTADFIQAYPFVILALGVILFFVYMFGTIGADSKARAQALYPDDRYNKCLSIILDKTESLADAEVMCKHYRSE